MTLPLCAHVLLGLQISALLLHQDFRFALARVRIHAEPVAFYNGAEYEKVVAEDKLDLMAKTKLSIMETRIPVNVFTNSFFFLPTVIPMLLLGPLYFSGSLKLGDLTKASRAFRALFNNFSTFVSGYGR